MREADTELDEVVRVDPRPGRALADGETVRLFVSLGEPLVVVPETIGLSITDATDRLTAAGFTVGEISEAADETVASGLVLALVTPGGAVELEPGTVVDLVVSTGPQDRTVPDMVASGNAADAIVQLAALRLTATEVREFDETIPALSLIHI